MLILRTHIKTYLLSWLLAVAIVMSFFTLQVIFVLKQFETHFIIVPLLLGTVIGVLLGSVMALRKELFTQRELFRTIADLSTNFSFYRKLDGSFQYVSPAVERITGYPPADFYTRPGLLRECIHPDDLTIWDSHVHDVDNDGRTRPLDIRFIHRNGEVRWLLHVCIGVKDEAGNIKGIRSNNMDITERRQAEEGLRRSQKMDALGKLTGGIAHDFNNLLGIVLGYAEILQETLKDQPQLTQYAQKIHNAGERGAKLTKKLLAFSRQKVSEAASSNLNTLLQDEKHLLEKTLTARIKLILNLSEDLWPVWLDSNDLEDAILNMSINAMHAMDGNGQLIIQTNNETINTTDATLLDLMPGDYVLLNIIDTGSGMDESTKEIIFDPFYSTKGENGTGLGLSQVYGFMQRSKGAIKVNSVLDHGTRFTLYFPRHHESSRKKQSIEVANTVDFKGTETILLVDDEPALLSLNAEILAQQGFNVMTAERAKKALDILEHETVDLLISDIIMPEMNGYQLAAIVKEKYPAIKIQLASGFADERNMGEVDEDLLKDLLSKPFTSQELLKRVHHLLNE